MKHLGSVRPLSALVLCAVAVCIGSTVRAGTINLFNTGVDSGGAPLAGGSVDPHWSVVDGPGITPPADGFVVSSPPSLYAESPASSWIWINPGGSGATGVPYTFRMTFDLTGFDPAKAMISGSWGVDNNGSINLNGSLATGTGALSLTGGGENNFTVLHDFSIAGGFVAGVNTLDFLAEDDGNPGALNVTNLVLTVTTSSVPEPGSLFLLGAGIVGLAALGRRRMSRSISRGGFTMRTPLICHWMTAAFVLAALSGGPAKAESMTYTEQVIGSGNLGSQTFAGANVTISFTGDTNDIQFLNSPGNISYFDMNVSGTVAVQGLGSATFVGGPYFVIDNQSNDFAGFASGLFAIPLLEVSSTAFSGYDLAGSFGPISGPTAQFLMVQNQTTAGEFRLTSTSGDVTFTATVSGASVPEPSTLVLSSIAVAGVMAYMGMRRKSSRACSGPSDGPWGK